MEQAERKRGAGREGERATVRAEKRVCVSVCVLSCDQCCVIGLIGQREEMGGEGL